MVGSILGDGPVADADAVIVGVPYDRNASFGTGASKGPGAILGCLHHQVEILERFSRTEPARLFTIAHEVLEDVAELPVEEMVRRVATRLSTLDPFVVVLGGTHSVTVGALHAHARRIDPHNVTVLQFDAHLDLRDDDSDYNHVDPSRYAHSCVMRRAHELGFRSCSVGARAYSRAEYEYATAHALTVFEWGRELTEPAVDEVLAALATDHVYITIDVDGFDPSVAPATGTPVPGGLSWAFGTALLRRVCLEKQVIGADIVETAPDGVSGLTEYAAAQLCYDLIGFTLLKARGLWR